MLIYDFHDGATKQYDKITQATGKEARRLILASPGEVSELQKTYGFDDSTVLDCENLDESVRYTSFEGYDFISLVMLDQKDDFLASHEINIYVSKNYIVLVLDDRAGESVKRLRDAVIHDADTIKADAFSLNRIYFTIFNTLLSGFSGLLELIEDKMEALSEEIIVHVQEDQFSNIYALRKISYAAKKQLRSMSYIGEQILFDENKILSGKIAVYFRNIDTRLKKLYDFAESLYGLGNELLSTYDSKTTIKTNDTINKLTVLTIIFAPLTLITGIYGMNFDFMPELRFRYAYPLSLLAMAAISIAIVYVLKRKKWL